ncbi:SGNH/GDSL hydrolase family protein [Planococcus lenghuensis]|uniref:Lysophospholipase n=1 Tax=Planococcus lenghuensis TaxID=2213202 RepID=A0A1Q2KXT2_9BACL|nr:GDSL-type esterase/lipase family protein [Planococcus lenghuensis]AQQ52472.1 lysophospholipase [Planococcus lenghuensis]
MKKVLPAALAAFMLTSTGVPAGAETTEPAAYVAIGDSLAAGQTPDQAIDAGYADLIAQELMRNQPVAFYTKDLAFPGLAAGDVLERIESDEAQDVLSKANLITVSAGANDLLRLVQADPATGAITFDQLTANFVLNNAREQIELLLAELAEQAPQADIYVMGYYFPYPHANDLQKPGLVKQLELLNVILEQEAIDAGAVFVPVAEAFGTEAVTEIPNPADVHPTVTGYQKMANAFFDQYKSAWQVEAEELPQPAPVTFEELREQRDQQEQQKSAAQPTDPVREAELDTLALSKPRIFL